MRVIRKNATSSAGEAVELLASLFAAEVLHPSRCLWVVSPWISDIPLVDNRFGNFPQLDHLGRRMITLAELLMSVADRGTTIVVATRADPINAAFVSRLRQLAASEGVTEAVRIVETPAGQRFHDKSLAGDDYVIAGSMNFTYAGALLNEEQIQFHTDPKFVADTQIDLYERFGGQLERD